MIKVNGEEYIYGFFPDGTLLMRFKVDEDINNIQYRLTWDFETLTEQIVLQNLVWHIKEKNPNARITLHLDYTPNARLDRIEKPDDIFTLKYFARVINELGFDRVYILDPHSPVAPAIINNVYIDINRYLKFVNIVIDKTTPDLLYYPDSGCKKRLENLIKHPNICGYKDRNWDTGDILDTEVLGAKKHNLTGKTILITDDICSYGGTFLYAAKKLKNLGVGKIYLYITHCENSILNGELINSGLLEKIYTTRSIFTEEHPLIEILQNN